MSASSSSWKAVQRVRPVQIRQYTQVQGRPYPRRFAFVLLRKLVREFFRGIPGYRMVALYGLRGVGKTVLLWQVLDYVYRNHTRDVWFVDGEYLRSRESRLLDVLPMDELVEREKPLVLAVDEVHAVEGWSQDLKILHDRAPRVFVIVTGSSALHLVSTPDLVSRWKTVPIFPLRFQEYLMLRNWITSETSQLLTPPKGLASHLREVLFFSPDFATALQGVLRERRKVETYLQEIARRFEDSLLDLFWDYIGFYNIPRFLTRPKADVVHSAWELLFRIVSEDLGLDFTSSWIQQVLMHLATDDVISLRKLSRTAGVAQEDVERVVSGLHRAGVLYVLMPFGGPGKKALYRRVSFVSPTLRYALFVRTYGSLYADSRDPRLLEDMAAMLAVRSVGESMVFFPDGKAAKKPDFVVATRDRPIFLEVKRGGKKGGSQITEYARSRNLDYRYGIVLGGTRKDVAWDARRRLIFLPFVWMLMV